MTHTQSVLPKGVQCVPMLLSGVRAAQATKIAPIAAKGTGTGAIPKQPTKRGCDSCRRCWNVCRQRKSSCTSQAACPLVE